MEREPRSYYFSLNLTLSERQTLERLAEERGGTLSGVLRKLIRDAAPSDLVGTKALEGRRANPR